MENKKNTNEKLNELKKMKEDYFTAIRTNGRSMLREVFNEFFEANPTVTAIGWTQYTPYFNDGEPCTFGVNDFYWTNSTDNDVIENFSGYEDEESWFSTWESTPGPNAPVLKAVRELERTLQGVNDLLETVLEDNSKIVVTRSDILVSEYEHD